MDRTGCPASYWLLCLLWVITVMNYTAAPSLDWKIPLTVLTGSTTDISILLCFFFYEPVFYASDNKWPSQSPERSGRFVGFALNKGNELTYQIEDDETGEIVTCSTMRGRLSLNLQ